MTVKQGQSSKRELTLLFFKGVCMGAADVVPGVSGGTIAFITGIYERLLSALRSLTPVSLTVLYREGLPAFWSRIDGWFLCVLFSGVFVSVLSLANVISYALEHFPILIWSFFFGLVLASIVYLVRQIPRWRCLEWLAIILGAFVVLLISFLRPAQLPTEWWMLFLSGALAICAMILPGISGSFILLLMGMYTVFIDAVKSLNLVLLLSFIAGCACGLLGFSHLLSWLLRRFRSVMYALLTGFLVGSLNVLWPWKQVLETVIDRHGQLVPLVQSNVSPEHYAELTSQPAYLLGSILCALFGFVLVLLLERIGSPSE